MNANRILLGECTVALGVGAWGAIRNHTAPFPAGVIATGVSFGLLGVLATATPELAVLIGGGFLLAQLLLLGEGQGTSGRWPAAFGAFPSQAVAKKYTYLMF